MKQVIVIGTSKGREMWASKCVVSCSNDKYEVVTIQDDGFELAHIRRAYDMKFDEFLYLHDTCEVKDKRLFDLVFEENEGNSVALSDSPCIFGMYLGKYKREALKTMEIPVVMTKLDAINYEEIWTTNYVNNELSNTVLLNYPLHDGYNFVTKYGRINMKLENDYLIKYKATWNRSMI